MTDIYTRETCARAESDLHARSGVTLHTVEPASLERRNEMAMFNLKRPATEAWFNRGWFEIACALTIPTEEHQ